MSDASLLASLLALEHSLFYGYGEAGGAAAAVTAAPPADLMLLEEGFAAHRLRRDQLTDALTARRAAAPAAKPAYSLPLRPTDLTGALTLAATLEDHAAAAYHDAIGATGDPGLRTFLLSALVDAAVREAQLKLANGAAPAAASVSLPGS